MPRTAAIDRLMSKIQRTDAAVIANHPDEPTDEDELKAVRESAESGEEPPAETVDEPPAAEPEPKPEPKEPPAEATEPPAEPVEKAKPHDDATRDENARMAQRRRDREARDAKA